MKIILGSQSKWRARILRDAGLVFDTMAADIDEKAVVVDSFSGDRDSSDPSLLTLAIATAKATALVPALKDKEVLLITSDQVVAFQGKIREKPESESQCIEYLKSYVSEPACTVTAVVVTNTKTGHQIKGVDIARQWFHSIPEDIVRKVIAKGDVMQCCGGFMIDDPDFEPYLAAREGSPESVMGLPVTLVLKLLEEAKAAIEKQ